jgi:hypothetical protein
MDWQSRIPDGVGDIQDTSDGFEAKVSIPADEDGYIGRLCNGCGGKFRMVADEYAALPDITRLTCPYCGRDGEPSNFITPAQLERAEAAVHAVAEQFMHQQIDNILGRTFGPGRRLRPGESGVEITYTPAARPPIRTLPEIIEERVLRTITCPNCSTHYAVYGASAFCPVCGPRAATDTVLEAIAAARAALALEDHLPANQRDAARAAGVFDRLAADTVKNIVSLFEVSPASSSPPAPPPRQPPSRAKATSSSASTTPPRCSASTAASTCRPSSARRSDRTCARRSPAGTCSFTATASSTRSSSTRCPTAVSRQGSGW